MAKETTKKSETKTTSTPKKKPSGKAKVSDKPMVEVVVKVAQFGNYKKGDTIKMVGSTAQGCIDSDLVELKN
jgi:hypothetical protein